MDPVGKWGLIKLYQHPFRVGKRPGGRVPPLKKRGVRRDFSNLS
jgi:hypothetical protein